VATLPPSVSVSRLAASYSRAMSRFHGPSCINPPAAARRQDQAYAAEELRSHEWHSGASEVCCSAWPSSALAVRVATLSSAYRELASALLGLLKLIPVRLEELNLLTATVGPGIEEEHHVASTAGQELISLASCAR
jgi:hypothetical protein